MNKQQKLSGPAVFFYSTIALTAMLSGAFFFLYYTGISAHDVILWGGIVSFMILYHFGLRILFGEITKRIKIDYRHPFFARKPFEARVFKLLRVRLWKDRVLTFDPAAFDLKTRSLEEVATTMAKSEVDHWINEVISLTSLLFSFIWGCFPAFFLTALAAMLFDFQFILVQRYNRPIAVRLMEHRKQKQPKTI